MESEGVGGKQTLERLLVREASHSWKGSFGRVDGVMVSQDDIREDPEIQTLLKESEDTYISDATFEHQSTLDSEYFSSLKTVKDESILLTWLIYDKLTEGKTGVRDKLRKLRFVVREGMHLKNQNQVEDLFDRLIDNSTRLSGLLGRAIGHSMYVREGLYRRQQQLMVRTEDNIQKNDSLTDDLYRDLERYLHESETNSRLKRGDGVGFRSAIALTQKKKIRENRMLKQQYMAHETYAEREQQVMGALIDSLESATSEATMALRYIQNVSQTSKSVLGVYRAMKADRQTVRLSGRQVEELAMNMLGAYDAVNSIIGNPVLVHPVWHRAGATFQLPAATPHHATSYEKPAGGV
ncbi:MAG: hypothetical protein ABIC95_03795 [archaeon]